MIQTLHGRTLIRGVSQMSSGRYSYTFSCSWGSLSPSCALLEAAVTGMGSRCVHRFGARAHASSATQVIGGARWYVGWEPGHQGDNISPPGTAAEAVSKGLPCLGRLQRNLQCSGRGWFTSLQNISDISEMPHKANDHVGGVCDGIDLSDTKSLT